MSSRKISYYTALMDRGAISFTLKRSVRKTISISVNPDLSIVVAAPINADVSSIQRRIEKRAKWIRTQQAFFESFIPTASPRQYVAGETHYYLGKQYRLKVVKSDVERVKLASGYIEVSQNGNRSPTRTKELLEQWLYTRAQIHFDRSLQRCHEKFASLELPPPRLRLRRMTKRWGSYNGRTIYLNTELIKAPMHCIDYVVMHELCHVKYRGHNKRFFDLLSRVMPDWKQRKERLEKISANFLPAVQTRGNPDGRHNSTITLNPG